MVSTSIVVVCHQVHPWLARCLAAAREEADEVVLVDNGSPGEAASTAARPIGVTVERLPRNVGFPAAVNRGLARASGDIVALLNDDAWPDPGWIESTAKVLADPMVAAVGPKVLFARPHAEIRLDEEPHFAPGDTRPLGRCIRRVTVGGVEIPLGALFGTGIHRLEEVPGRQGGPLRTMTRAGRCWRDHSEAGHQWRWSTGSGSILLPMPVEASSDEVRINGEPVPILGMSFLINNAGSYLSTNGHGGDFGFGAPDGGVFSIPAERFATTGAAMVVRAETFRQLGGLAASFFAYYEDTDWCWRARLAGMSIRYDPSAVVHHVGGATTGGFSAAQVRRLAARNRIHTLARNAPMTVLCRELRSPVDRPMRGMALPLARSVGLGLGDRYMLKRHWARPPQEVWSEWAGRDERAPDYHG